MPKVRMAAELRLTHLPTFFQIVFVHCKRMTVIPSITPVYIYLYIHIYNRVVSVVYINEAHETCQL